VNALLLLSLVLLGACVGSVLNLIIYRLCWNVRSISPWTPGVTGDKADGGLHWSDRLPVLGWWSLRRKTGEHGRGFWIRPLAVELLTGLLFAALYWWEVSQQGLLPMPGFQALGLPPDIWPAPGGLSMSLHLMWQSHLILACLMIAASLIDIDDRIIPDTITVPGTLAGLFLAAVVPWSLLPNLWVVVAAAPPVKVVDFLKLSSPLPWPASLRGFPHGASLAIGLACYWGWCLALLPRHWRTRRGWKMALAVLWARISREAVTWTVLELGLIGSLLIAGVWWLEGPQWAGLLTALVGMAASGGLVWTVRIIGTLVLGREAMGFGDVTLMGMIGAFLGWQASLMIFFIAPFCALVIGAGYWILRRDPEIPYGPFLCLGALVVIVRWAELWTWAQPMFALGWLVPLVMLCCMLLMAVLLGGMRILRGLFRSDR
jgi:leader peptidase (prepilin peptidase)/N-methyltransferase